MTTETNEYNARVNSVIENQLDGFSPMYSRYIHDTMGCIPDFTAEADAVLGATVAFTHSHPECYHYPATARTEVAKLKSAIKSISARLPNEHQRKLMSLCAYHVEYVAKCYCDYVRERRELWWRYRGPNMPPPSPPPSPTVHENKVQ